MRAAKSGARQVTEYIAAAPVAARPMLRELRRLVREVAPRAEEKISYGMPYYSHFGRLTYFAAFSRHVSLFAMGRSKAQFAKEMKPYLTSASTMRFPFGTKIPARLIRRLVRARALENEAARKR